MSHQASGTSDKFSVNQLQPDTSGASGASGESGTSGESEEVKIKITSAT